MKLDEFRLEMESYRQDANSEAMALKDSYLVLERLHALYEKFDAEEQMLANQVIEEWVLSEEERMRFDALALIDDFKIVSAATALRKLANRLPSSNAPGAPFELRKVNRIIESLAL
jgi:cysteinyl-tRNA synthetase